MSHRSLPPVFGAHLDVNEYAPLSTSDEYRFHSHHTPGMQTQEKQTWRQNAITFLRDNKWFQTFTAALIIANAAVIGLETDFPDLDMWTYFENAFLLIFFTEMIFKMVCLGIWEYFRPTGEDVYWNYLDFIVVGLGFFELVTETLMHPTNSRNSYPTNARNSYATLFRMFRLLRILRIFRIVRFLKELYLLAYGLALAASAIVWVTVLMAFVLYTCAIILVRTVGRTASTDPGHDLLSSNFNSIPRSMLTLFNFMTQPDLEPYKDVILHYPAFGAFLILFTIFGSFGLIALLTGVIGESMFEKNQLKIQEERRDAEERRKMLLQICEDMLNAIPELEDGKVERKNVENLVPDIQSLFDSERIPYALHEFETMLNAMDKNGDGKLSKDDFVGSVLQIAEGIRPISLIEIHSECQECLSQMTQLKADVSTCLQHLAQLAGNMKVSGAVSAAHGPIGPTILEVGPSGNRDVAMEKLQSLVIQLREELQQLGRGAYKVTDIGPNAVGISDTSQMAALRENIDKSLRYREEVALFGDASSGASTADLQASRLSMRSILLDLRRDVQSLAQIPGHAICSHPDVHTPLRMDYAARIEAVEAKLEAKLEGVVQSLVEQLAQRMDSLPLGNRSAKDKLDTRAQVKAGFSTHKGRQSREDVP